MGQDTGEVRPQPLTDSDEKSPEQLRAEIEGVRADLGDTAAALAAKTDVKTRARTKAEQVKQTASGKKDDLLSKVGRGTNGSASGESGGGSRAAVEQLEVKAQQNPVLVAAAAALVGGFALGRLTRRDA
jgi:Protein of unknown function (DUF3618)